MNPHPKTKRELVYNPDYLDFQKGVEAGRITGRQAGIREVVDEIRKHCFYAYGDFGLQRIEEIAWWQDKLWEWGINYDHSR